MRGVAGLNRPRNLPERVGQQRRRQEQIREDIERANAEGLRARARKLDRVEQTAVRVVGEGVPIARRVAAHRRDLATARTAVARRRLRRKIALLHEVERRGLVENVNGKPRPRGKFADVYELARQSGARREARLPAMSRPADSGSHELGEDSSSTRVRSSLATAGLPLVCMIAELQSGFESRSGGSKE